MMRLNPPPDYEYETVGPWWITVAHPNGAVEPPLTFHIFESAMVAFWANDAPQPSWHRMMTDARGVTVIGISYAAGVPTMVGTRQAMEATLGIVERNAPEEEVVEVLSMVERVREHNGNAT